MLNKPLALSTAYAAWVFAEHDDQWVVYDEAKNELGKLPKHWNEKDCMIAIRLGRKYELEAFNIGIAFGKSSRDKALIPIIEQKDIQIQTLEQMNIKLSEKLEKFIIGKTEEEN